MSFTRKKPGILLIILFVFLANHSMAQHAGMPAIYHQMDMRLQQMQMKMMMAMGQFRYLGKTTYLEPVSNEYIFQVTMKDSTVRTVFSKISTDTIKHRCYLCYEDEKLLKTDPQHASLYIYPDQTICITRVEVDDRNDSTMVYGSARDSCWMFKTMKGKLNAYSYLSEMGDYFNVTTLVGIQMGINNPIENFNDKNLIKMIGKDRKAMKHLDDDEYFAAIEKFNDDN